MKVRILAVDRIREPSIAASIDIFRTRLRRYIDLTEEEVAPVRGAQPQRVVADESERILRRLDPTDTVWLLERSGTSISSEALAGRIEAMQISGSSRLTLVIAGTFGAAPELIARADFCWSLSELTLLHEWARAIVFEQLYRAMKIIRGEPYHH